MACVPRECAENARGSRPLLCNLNPVSRALSRVQADCVDRTEVLNFLFLLGTLRLGTV